MNLQLLEQQSSALPIELHTPYLPTADEAVRQVSNNLKSRTVVSTSIVGESLTTYAFPTALFNGRIFPFASQLTVVRLLPDRGVVNSAQTGLISATGIDILLNMRYNIHRGVSRCFLAVSSSTHFILSHSKGGLEYEGYHPWCMREANNSDVRICTGNSRSCSPTMAAKCHQRCGDDRVCHLLA